MKPRNALLVAALGMLCTPAYAWWLVETSLFRCQAVWFDGPYNYVRLLSDKDTYQRRLGADPDLDPKQPVLQMRYARGQLPPLGETFQLCGADRDFNYTDADDTRYGESVCAMPWNEDQTEAEIEMRLFPDEDEEERRGFFPITVRYGIGYMVEWTEFDLHDRLQRWGTAKETKDDEGVRLPEVRMIFKWRNRKDIHFDPTEDGEANAVPNVRADFYVDFPLWRTTNVMNKLNRCLDELTVDW